MGIESVISVIGGLGGAVAVIVTSLRKRQDISIEEMQRRIGSLEGRVTHLEDELEKAEQENALLRRRVLNLQRTIFALRGALVGHGLPDPTEGKDEA